MYYEFFDLIEDYNKGLVSKETFEYKLSLLIENKNKKYKDDCYDEAYNQAKKEFEDDIKSLQSENEDLENEVVSLEKTIDELENENTKLLQQVDSVSKQIKSLEQQSTFLTSGSMG
jgi:predicted  nucleic acid-binding Zn-ribbon protein